MKLYLFQSTVSDEFKIFATWHLTGKHKSIHPEEIRWNINSITADVSWTLLPVAFSISPAKKKSLRWFKVIFLTDFFQPTSWKIININLLCHHSSRFICQIDVSGGPVWSLLIMHITSFARFFSESTWALVRRLIYRLSVNVVRRKSCQKLQFFNISPLLCLRASYHFKIDWLDM